jgi:hypothetical protein
LITRGLAGGSVLLAVACGGSRPGSPTSPLPPGLLSQARPIGPGPRFQPPVRGPVLGRCQRALGPRYGVHIEVFAQNRVVLIPAGIGTLVPGRYAGGRIVGARCYGRLVTLDPTGLVLVRPGRPPALGDLFHSWGQPLSRGRIAGFAAAPGQRVAAYVDGRPWPGRLAALRLRRHAEIVLEVGLFVPPHRFYRFPTGA